MAASSPTGGSRAANEAATSLGEFASVADAYYCVVSWKSGMIDALTGGLVRGRARGFQAARWNECRIAGAGCGKESSLHEQELKCCKRSVIGKQAHGAQ